MSWWRMLVARMACRTAATRGARASWGPWSVRVRAPPGASPCSPASATAGEASRPRPRRRCSRAVAAGHCARHRAPRVASQARAAESAVATRSGTLASSAARLRARASLTLRAALPFMSHTVRITYCDIRVDCKSHMYTYSYMRMFTRLIHSRTCIHT